MSNHGMLLLNRVVEDGDFKALKQVGIDRNSFVSKTEQSVYDSIAKYYEQTGEVPSYALLSDDNPDFMHIPNVTDSYEVLAEKVLNRRMQVEFNELFNSPETQRLLDEGKSDMSSLIKTLTSEMESIKVNGGANVRSVGQSLKADSEAFLDEYKKRQAGESFDVWKSFMPYLNSEMGGYASGNFFVTYARSGRGKSVFTLREALEFAMQGATVLYWALEMDFYSVLTRLYTMLSAKLGKTKITLNGEQFDAGFGTKDIRHGTLAPEFEEEFEKMLSDINEYVPGEIIVKSVDDPTFVDRSIKQLESDVATTESDVAIIDPLYLMTQSANISKTAGGDSANTSKQIRLLSGQMNIPIIGVTQSDEGEDEGGEDEIRELHIPKRKDVKKSKAYLEDSSSVIGLDSDYTQQRAVVGIKKGRNGGEGTTAELTFIPSHGIVEELQIDASDFDF